MNAPIVKKIVITEGAPESVIMIHDFVVLFNSRWPGNGSRINFSGEKAWETFKKTLPILVEYMVDYYE